jgi:hypothetical protein
MAHLNSIVVKYDFRTYAQSWVDVLWEYNFVPSSDIAKHDNRLGLTKVSKVVKGTKGVFKEWIGVSIRYGSFVPINLPDEKKKHIL